MRHGLKRQLKRPRAKWPPGSGTAPLTVESRPTSSPPRHGSAFEQITRTGALMLNTQEPAAPSVPPHVQLIQMAVGSWVAAVVHAAAELGLADHLAGGPRSAIELAGAT